jgi:hypothetical protein
MSPDNLASNPVGWKLALAALLFLFLVIGVFDKLDPKRPIIDDLNGGGKTDYFSTDTAFVYAPGRLFEMLGKYCAPRHFDAHRCFVKYDLAFALLYAAAAAVIIVYLQNALAHTPGDPSRPSYLWLAPLFAGAFDILEGLSMWAILNTYRKGPTAWWQTALALFSTTMTMGKTLFLVATSILLITGGAALVLKKVWHLNL